MSRKRERRRRDALPAAVVLGDIDLVTALGRGRIPCVVVAPPADPARFSRFVMSSLAPLDHWHEPEPFVERLVAWASTVAPRPVLYYQTDGDLLMVSRYRERLGEVFRFVIPDAALVEDLVDKARFQRLASDHQLPVPRSIHLPPDAPTATNSDLRFPLVVKPLTRAGLPAFETHGKAVAVDDEPALRATHALVARSGIGLLAQELVPGGEDRIESYHAYIDGAGAIAAEFTGRKLRTYPSRFGHSTSVVITESPAVADLGRDIVGRLGLRGVVKLDFKRDQCGRLWLLEVNPRFSLWHHPGAVSGVNLPALVYADLTGRGRPRSAPARAGVRWIAPRSDRWAARELGLPAPAWWASLVAAEARRGASWDDPMPALRGEVLPALRRKVAERAVRFRRHGTTVASDAVRGSL